MKDFFQRADLSTLNIEHDSSLNADDTKFIPSVINRMKTFNCNEDPIARKFPEFRPFYAVSSPGIRQGIPLCRLGKRNPEPPVEETANKE